MYPKNLYEHREIGLWPIMLPNCNYFVTKMLYYIFLLHLHVSHLQFGLVFSDMLVPVSVFDQDIDEY
jgi:hypothetical protein